MSALLQSLQAEFDARPAHPILHKQQSKALHTAIENGLPTQRMERWKYTSLRALSNRKFETAGTTETAISVDHIPTPRMVFVDGRFNAELSKTDSIAVESLAALLESNNERDYFFLQRCFERHDETFAQLNAALANDGVVLRLSEMAHIDQTLHAVFITSEHSSATHSRHLIELAAGTALTLIEHHVSLGNAAGISNHLWHIHLAPDTALQHIRLQQNSEGQTDITRCDVVIASSAHYQRRDIELGNHLTRLELNADLQGENASFISSGAILGDGKRHTDVRLNIEHIAQHTSCELNWRSIGKDRSRIAFHGGIAIRAGADHTSAHLSNKNLLLSEHAEIDTQPLMEIHADEVVASHGATIGQLDQNALFYLRSRGIDAEQARELLMQAFLREPLSANSDELFTQWVEPALNTRLQGSL
jgi:Fe-S cluster assembly protein SufD